MSWYRGPPYLQELSCGQRVLVSGLFDVFATPDGTGLEVRSRSRNARSHLRTRADLHCIPAGSRIHRVHGARARALTVQVRLPEGRDTLLQLGDIDKVRLSLTVVRRGDSKLMRVCREAGLVEGPE